MKFVSPIRTRAFTLIELVIGAALSALILVSAYLCLSAGIKGKKMVEPRTDALQTARVVLAMLTADLRNACPLPGDSPFIGMQRRLGKVEADNLDFATHNYTPHRPHEGDFCEVSYYVNQDPQTGRFSLWRRRNPTLAPDPLSGGRKEKIASNLLGIRLEYFDGMDWYDNWGEAQGQTGAENSSSEASNSEGLPEAVRITLMLDSDPTSQKDNATGERKVGPPLVFQTVAYLNLADASSASGNSESPGSAGPESNGGEMP